MPGSRRAERVSGSAGTVTRYRHRPRGAAAPLKAFRPIFSRGRTGSPSTPAFPSKWFHAQVGPEDRVQPHGRPAAQRPGKMRLPSAAVTLAAQLFVYDGRSSDARTTPADEDSYATVGAPGHHRGHVLDFARESRPASSRPPGDVLYRDAYAILMDGVVRRPSWSKQYVIERRALRPARSAGPSPTCRVWIQEGPQPLMRAEIVVTTRDHGQCAAVLRDRRRSGTSSRASTTGRSVSRRLPLKKVDFLPAQGTPRRATTFAFACVLSQWVCRSWHSLAGQTGIDPGVGVGRYGSGSARWQDSGVNQPGAAMPGSFRRSASAWGPRAPWC